MDRLLETCDVWVPCPAIPRCEIGADFTTDSVTRSPLYSLYGETIAGVSVLRAFGASSKFMRDMLRCADTVRDVVPLYSPIVADSATEL